MCYSHVDAIISLVMTFILFLLPYLIQRFGNICAYLLCKYETVEKLQRSSNSFNLRTMTVCKMLSNVYSLNGLVYVTSNNINK